MSIDLEYPPDEILNPTDISGKKFEYIILWMLSKNETCQWSDFLSDRVNLQQSTLSNYLSALISKGHIIREKRAHYQITPEGRARFLQLTENIDSKDLKISYPPKSIQNERNYQHLILWMLNNNNEGCKWSDFTEGKLKINQSSLSKNMNILLDKEFIDKKNKVYFITNSGKIEYFSILKLYSLDRQSLLDEESKRLKELTQKMDEFFDEHNIIDDEVKFRFLNLLLELDYSKTQTVLRNPKDFDKILLYLAINHPNFFPEFKSINEFSAEYSIKDGTLKYWIDLIVDENFFPAVKFFIIKTDKNQVYYFHADEKIEKVLRAITVEKIRDLKLLKQHHKQQEGTPSLNSKLITTHILKDSLTGVLFKRELRPHLRKFIENTYIEYLTYTIKKIQPRRPNKYESRPFEEF